MNTASRVFLAALILGASQAAAEEKLYRINSRDVGWSGIDLTVTETRREPQVSHVSIPGYRNRTPVESRFAQCAFTDMAIQRRFAVWIASDIGGDKLLVGFLKSEDEDVEKALGPRFVQPNVVRASVLVVNRMCGIRVK